METGTETGEENSFEIGYRITVSYETVLRDGYDEAIFLRALDRVHRQTKEAALERIAQLRETVGNGNGNGQH